MRKTFSSVEPAERPLTVALSDAELIAVINYHVAATRRISKATGKMLLEKRASNLFFKSRESNVLIAEARKLVDAHMARAIGLQSILKA